jgi:hypothetical protein
MLVYQRVVGRDCGDGMIVNIVTDYGSFPQFRTFLAPLEVAMVQVVAGW